MTWEYTDIVAKLTQQNAALRTQAAAGGQSDDDGTGTSSRKLSAMLAASEKRAADSLERVQGLLKREVRLRTLFSSMATQERRALSCGCNYECVGQASLMEETASLHEQLDRAKVRPRACAMNTPVAHHILCCV